MGLSFFDNMYFNDLQVLIVYLGNYAGKPSEKGLSLMYQVLVHLGVEPSWMQFLVEKVKLGGAMVFKFAPHSLLPHQKKYLMAFLVVLYSIESEIINKEKKLFLEALSAMFDVPIMNLQEAWNILNI